MSGDLVRARGNREIREIGLPEAGCFPVVTGLLALPLIAAAPGLAALVGVGWLVSFLPWLVGERKVRRLEAAQVEHRGGTIEAIRAEVVERGGEPWCLVVVWFHSFFYSRVPEVRLKLAGTAFRPKCERLSLGTTMREHPTIKKPKRSGRWAFRFLFSCEALNEHFRAPRRSIHADFEVRVYDEPLATARFRIPLAMPEEPLALPVLAVTLGAEGFCPVCGDDLEGEVIRCPECETPHHQDCWQWAGSCATFGCHGWA